MSGFIIIAALLALLGAGVVGWPLLRRDAQRPREALAALLVLALIGGGGSGLYALWSHWSWQAPATDSTPQSMVSSLVRRLDNDPDDLQGWLMLGRSYAVLEQYPLATRAYQRADRLAGGRNAEALEGWAEALTLNNEDELAGRAGRLFEQALTIDPQSGKSLFFAGIAAQRRGELPLARQRFASLLAGNPPENVRPMLEQQIAALDVAISRAGAGAGAAGASGAAGAAAGAAPSRSAGSAAAPPARIILRVSIAPALAARVRGDAPLFVLARSPGQPGPPLAVKRLGAKFPQQVELTAGDSMMPGRAIAAGQTVEVVARLALGGNPTGTPGDLLGMLRYQVGKDGARDLVIDKVSP